MEEALDEGIVEPMRTILTLFWVFVFGSEPPSPSIRAFIKQRRILVPNVPIVWIFLLSLLRRHRAKIESCGSDFGRRKFRSLTSDNMERWKAEQRSRVRRKKIQLRESQKKEDTHARNVRKVAKCYIFQMIFGPAGSKSRLAKAAGAEPCGQRRNEKWHAAVAPSTFSSQNIKNTPASHHFLKFSCRKMSCRCGAKHIPSQNVKTCGSIATFSSADVKKWHAAVARSTFTSQNAQNTYVLDHFSTFRCRKGVGQKS